MMTSFNCYYYNYLLSLLIVIVRVCHFYQVKKSLDSSSHMSCISSSVGRGSIYLGKQYVVESQPSSSFFIGGKAVPICVLPCFDTTFLKQGRVELGQNPLVYNELISS